MPQYPASPFESAVAGFLGSYNMMGDIKQRKQDQLLRKRQADTADQEATVRLANEGYDRITMPTIGPPPDQSFASRVGSYLSGGPDQPSSIVMKTGPSAADEAATRNEAFITSRDTAISARDLQVAGVRVAGETARDAVDRASREKIAADAQAGENYRAGLYRGEQGKTLEANQRQKFFDDAVGAVGGDPSDPNFRSNAAQAAMAYAATQHPATAKALKATRTDYYAAAQRRVDSKAEISRETIGQRADAAAARGGGFLTPPGVTPPGGATPLAPLAPSDKQAAAQDPGFAAHLVQRGYVKGRDF